MNAEFTPVGVEARRRTKTVSVSGPLRPARRIALHEVPFAVISEGERALGPAARGRGPGGGSGKEPA